MDRVWFYSRHLDEAVMQAAADQFVELMILRRSGLWALMCALRCGRCISTRCSAEGKLLALTVSANGFLYNMARAMAGTVVYAAEGKFPPDAIGGILAGGEPDGGGTHSPGRGPVSHAPVV